MKKGIKGQLTLPISQLDMIKKNSDLFNERMETELYVKYQIAEAEYKGDDIILIEFDLMNNTSAQVKADYSHFKKVIKEVYGKKPVEFLALYYDKV